ncbi:MAG: 3-methyl-2-oxobutanoate hydroxymethyltransferase [bacterium]|nr:3-methyl-2-oxobutanoate hydroxymethyltransferase [bacterium]
MITRPTHPPASPAASLAALAARKATGEKIVALTAYDYLTASWLAECPVDFILVGDSLGNVIAGYPSTLPVTMDEMVYHTRMVVRGAAHIPVIADMPFLSYEVTPEDALRNAGRLVKEAGAHGVKIEGGEADVAAAVKKIVRAHIPVLGHVGLKPQSVLQLGGYKVQGRTTQAAERIREEAHALQEAGVFAIVLECVPHLLARQLTRELSVPTIGIGAGNGCDGQILVTHDLLGWFEPPKKFVKLYAHFRTEAIRAVTAFARDVRAGVFPSPRHSF